MGISHDPPRALTVRGKPQAGLVAQIAWSQADEWARDGVLLAGVAQALGLTSEEVDELFRAANAMTV